MTEIKWAIIGAGGIAKQFATELVKQENTKLVAVASRTQESAQAFAKHFGIAHIYESDAGLIEQSDADIVYIASPHNLHYSQTKACLLAGKAVLCEKPVCLNHHQAEEIIQLAKQKNLFFMEAMITPLLPGIQTVLEMIDQGTLGKVNSIQASFGISAQRDMSNRLFNPELAGGALLDLGIYPLTFSYLITKQRPQRIASLVEKAETGVDMQSNISLQYPCGIIANVSCSVGNYMPCVAHVFGEKMSVEIENFSWGATKLTLRDQSGAIQQTQEFENNPNAYFFEAKYVNECLQQGLLESSLDPHYQTLDIMKTMDEIRAQWGLKYPGE